MDLDACPSADPFMDGSADIELDIILEAEDRSVHGRLGNVDAPSSGHRGGGTLFFFRHTAGTASNR
jgi:hypothetical protein